MAQIKNRRAPIFVDSQDNVVSGGSDFSLVYNDVSDVDVSEKVISFDVNYRDVLLFIQKSSTTALTIFINTSISVASVGNKFSSIRIYNDGGRLFSNYATTTATYGSAVLYTRGFNGSGFIEIDTFSNLRITGDISAGTTITVYAR